METVERMLRSVNARVLEDVILYHLKDAERVPGDIDLTEHLEVWAKNKAHIYEMFGNKLTIEREIDTELSPYFIQQKLEKFLEVELAAPKFKILTVFLSLIRLNELRSNLLEDDFIMFDTTFKKGTKVTKCFRQLLRSEDVEEATTKYSMFLQSLKTKGVAVLSIDPVDYLTMSCNNSGWSSCHSLHGDYRAGTVSYMMDSSTIIGYVKATRDYIINYRVSHTNKIWRQIVLVNENLDFAIQARQYPNSNDINSRTIGEMMQELLEKATGDAYKRTRERVEDRVFSYLQSNHDGPQLYYNDIAARAFTYAHVLLKENESVQGLVDKIKEGRMSRAIVGHDVPCLCGCGINLSRPGSLFVENEECDDEYYE